MRKETRRWIELDRTYCWHPFTRQGEWCADGHEPLVLVEGKGVWLWDSEGRRYLDGNSSIWTNIHGHGHPLLLQALAEQSRRVAHTSFLGFTHPGAAELAAQLCGFFVEGTLDRVFFSDNGSTAVECALKMAVQYRMQCGQPERRGFIAFAYGYHGDTLGAASLGGVGRFFERFRGLGYPVTHVASMAELEQLDEAVVGTAAGVVIEPLVQGVNEMRLWPKGMLVELRRWCDAHGVHLILDEVMTGFGRTGEMFACHWEAVAPDFLCLAKGLTGGYLPMAATLTTEEVYDAFLGDAGRAFYYGHSYTANPLGCELALASLEVFRRERTLEGLAAKEVVLGLELSGLAARVGERFCVAMRAHGVLTRPVLDTVVLMPPLCVTPDEIRYAVGAVDAVLSARPAWLDQA